MGIIFKLASGFFGIVAGILSISMLLMGNWLQGMTLAAIAFLIFPPFRGVLCGRIPCWVRPFLVVGFGVLFVWLGSLNRFYEGIYKSPHVKATFEAMYDAKMAEWPTSYEERFIETEYGKVHVIVSGFETAPALILFHVSGLPAWSWEENVAELNRHFRTYAIDTLGDAGRSELKSRGNFPKEGKSQAALYSEVMEKLGLESAYVAGGSEGGFIGTNLALYAPKRVKKLALIGPMGFGGTTESVLRIVLTQLFPLKSLQESMISWAFGDDPKLVGKFGPWFRLLMDGTFPQKAQPVSFLPDQLERLQLPVLLILGKKDNLVGDPDVSKRLAENLPDVHVEVLDTGHFVAAEDPTRVNQLLIRFFNEEASR